MSNGDHTGRLDAFVQAAQIIVAFAISQGAVQGSLSSLASVAGVLGPPLATGLFGFFINAGAPVKLPGAAFFFSSALTVAAMLLAVRSFRRELPAAKTEPAPELRADSAGG